MHFPIPSKGSPTSLDSLLSLFSSRSVVSLLESEIVSLSGVLSGIYVEMRQRRELEAELLSILEYRELYLDSRKLNLRPYQIQADSHTLSALDHDLALMEREQIQTRQATVRDLLDLKKLSWHYILMLHQKSSLMHFLQ
jgi:hypothetical protein